MDAKTFVEKYAIRSIACCFSGGRSSLCATHYVLSQLEEVNIEKYVLFVDTGVMVPSAPVFVREVAERYGWNLRVLKPKTDFWTYAAKYGMPTHKRRWCCYLLKLQPIFDFVKQLPPPRAEVVGFRGDESRRRKKSLRPEQVSFDKRHGVQAWVYLPLLNWTEEQVVKYIREHALPMPPHYRLGIKETCCCGAFTTRRQLMSVKAHYPEFFQKFIELENKFRMGNACFYFGKPTYARELAKQKTLTSFVEQKPHIPGSNPGACCY